MPAIMMPFGADMTRRYVPVREHYPVVYSGRASDPSETLNSHVVENRRRQIAARRSIVDLESNKRKPVDQGIARGHLPAWWANAVPGANAAAAAAEGQFI